MEGNSRPVVVWNLVPPGPPPPGPALHTRVRQSTAIFALVVVVVVVDVDVFDVGRGAPNPGGIRMISMHVWCFRGPALESLAGWAKCGASTTAAGDHQTFFGVVVVVLLIIARMVILIVEAAALHLRPCWKLASDWSSSRICYETFKTFISLFV